MYKQALSYIFTILIILALSVAAYFLYFVNDDLALRIAGSILIVLVAIAWFFHERRQLTKVRRERAEPIRRFVLMTRDGEREKEWHCGGMPAFLVGKGSAKREVDIDLGGTQYSDYISPEHATLNYVRGYWYIEDLNSRNGVGLKKKGEEYALRLKPFISYKVDNGDIIYIAKTKMLAR